MSLTYRPVFELNCPEGRDKWIKKPTYNWKLYVGYILKKKLLLQIHFMLWSTCMEHFIWMCMRFLVFFFLFCVTSFKSVFIGFHVFKNVFTIAYCHWIWCNVLWFIVNYLFDLYHNGVLHCFTLHQSCTNV